MPTPIQTATKRARRAGPSGRAIPEPEDYQELRRSLEYKELVSRAAKAESAKDWAPAYHWFRAAKEKIPLLDDPDRRSAGVRELFALENHLDAHAFTAAELVARFSHEEETAEETLVRVAVQVINELHSPMFTSYEDSRARCIGRLRPLREYVDALDRSLQSRRAASTKEEANAKKPVELTGKQILMLRELRREVSPVHPETLAKALGKHRNACRAQGNQLALKGLARRHKLAGGLHYEITEEGCAALDREESGVVELRPRR